jgi:hypothetical protein
VSDDLQDYAVMVICAADVDQIWHICTDDGATPDAQPTLPDVANIIPQQIGYVHSGNFQAIGQLRCNDIFITGQDNVYYGLVLVATAAVGPVSQGDLLIAIRGTMDDLEWLNDAIALQMIPGRAGAIGLVGAGFWKIYQSMSFCSLDGVPVPGELITQLIGAAHTNNCPRIFVCGHSLGAALATYLTYDLNASLGPLADTLHPYFFASPKTGTSDWVNGYQRAVKRYDLTNYALDFVPMVPPDGDTLNAGSSDHNVHIIAALSPGALDTGAFANFDASKNHSPIGYARMLDGTNTVARRLLAAGA